MSLKIKCPICNSKKSSLFHNKVWSCDKRKVYKCHSCGVAFIYPIMSEEEEKVFYLKYHKHVKKRGFSPSQSTNKLHSISRDIAKERLNRIKHFFLGTKSILEIGSSTGAFLEILNNAGVHKQLTGIEPFDASREYSKRFTKDVYPDISYIPADKKFDIICMFHIFEHIRSPMDFLAQCKHHLASGGIFLIEVPFIQDPLISLYDCSAFRDFYFQPMHPYIYSLKALRYVCSKNDLHEKDVIYYQRYGLDNHLAWLSKKKPGGDKYFNEIFGNNQIYKEALEKIGKTDTLFYITQNI